ncbi:putative membrane protein [Vibrio harveyi]|nr:putative membrane protein [Vibrio harveyi]EKM31135.1 putative membrane protein [Vibrio harveyi]
MKREESMWKKDWADAAVVVAWVAVWSTLVYFVPLTGF